MAEHGMEFNFVIKDKSGTTKQKENKKSLSDTLKNTKAIELSSLNISKNFKRAFDKGSVIGWALAIKSTIDTMIKASKKQAEYIESLNLMQVAFGDTKDAAENFVQTLSNATGFDTSGLTKQLGIFRQLTSTLNITSSAADLLAYNLEKMSLDISSLYNVDLERAGNALQSAITGQVRSIRTLTGADITQATLQQEALALGIDKSVKSMSRAEKTILIYLSLERQLSNANGDVSRTINSVANQTRIWKDQISMLARNLGGLLIPVLKTILPILNGIMMVANELVSMLLGLFGIDASSLASEFGIASSGLEDLEDDLDGVASASDKAKKSLRGFDKLNNITTSTGSSGSGVGVGLGNVDTKLLEKMQDYNLHLDEMNNKAKKIKDNIMYWLGFSKQVNGEWKWSAKDLLKRLVDGWERLNGAGKIFATLGLVGISKKIFDIFKKIVDLFKGSKVITNLGKFVDLVGKKGLFSAMTDIIKKAPKFTKILGVTGILGGLLKVVDVFKDLYNFGKKGFSIDGLKKTFEDILQAVGLLVSGISLITGNGAGLIIGGIVGAFGLLAESIRKSEDELKIWQEQANDKIWNDLAVYQSVQNLSKELENYIGENGKVQESDEARVNYILNQMNDAFGTEYELIDGVITQNGILIQSYKDVQTEVDKYMTKIKTQMTLEKYAEKYNDALVKKEEKQKKINILEDDYNKVMDEINSSYDELMKKYGDEEKVQSILEEQRRAATETYKRSLENINEEYQEYIDLANTYEALREATFYNNLEDMNKFTEQLIGSQAILTDNTLKELEKTTSAIRSSVQSVLNRADGYKSGSDWASGATDAIKKQFNTGFELNFSVKGGIPNLTQKADGGFVNSGDIFVANENNRPEYVGSFGNQTAVANTDQIVDGIAIGVTRAMMAVGANKDTKVVIEAKGDASGLMDFITFEQRKKDRQYGL